MPNDELLQITGQENTLEWVDQASVRSTNSSIQVSGHHNRIRIGAGVVLNGCTLQISSDHNTIVIEDRCRITGKVIMKLTDGNRLEIGEGTSVGGCNFICGEGTSIRIGKDCMIAWGVEIRSTDSHAIFSCEDGERVNAAQDIEIGSHVWISAQAVILKGTRIGNHSVVGMRALVSDQFTQDHVIVAGVPARVIKQGIDWDRRLLG